MGREDLGLSLDLDLDLDLGLSLDLDLDLNLDLDLDLELDLGPCGGPQRDGGCAGNGDGGPGLVDGADGL